MCTKKRQPQNNIYTHHDASIHIKLREGYSDAYKSLCVVLMKLNEPEEAVKYACVAAAIEPVDYIFDFVTGTAYLKMKAFDKSIAPLNNALEKSPNNITIYNSLGTAYMALSKSSEAIKCYEKALELNPKNPMAYYNIGSALQIQQRHEEACTYLRKAVELDEEDEGFKVALAMSLVKSEKFQEALNIYKSLLVMHPEKENYKYNLITCYEALGDIQTAISMLEGMVYVNQKFILPAQKLASLYIKTNQLAKAKEIYDNILSSSIFFIVRSLMFKIIHAGTNLEGLHHCFTQIISRNNFPC